MNALNLAFSRQYCFAQSIGLKYWNKMLSSEQRHLLMNVAKSSQNKFLISFSVLGEQKVSVDPRTCAKALERNCSRLWRSRIGDLRVICEIYDETITVLVVLVGRSKEAYQE
jgi:mRNA-degrading endonuclease RelE of RelBE toxin-antitoxin system